MPNESMMEVYRRNPKEGFRRLYGEYAPRLKAYLMSSFGLSSHASEDIIHDAFLPWVEIPARMVAIENPTAYLFASVRNGALQAKRRPTSPLDNQEATEAPAVDPTTGIEIRRALENIREEQREAVVLRVWGGMSLAELAEHQGVPLQTASSRYRSGLAKLKELLSWVE
ncbi:MAG TPA: RNA polymerase sigma factor [Candidatus Ozemobacteraceae bacterium]|nr:RNA polymerase sigma factor [Candidatus Ozemobacteraceae bacterium]